MYLVKKLEVNLYMIGKIGNMEEQKIEKMTIFEHLNNLTQNKEMIDENDPEAMKTFDTYMVNRFVSMKQIYVMLCNEINKHYYNLSKLDVYRILFHTLPQTKQFFPYIKKPKEINKKEKECLSKYWQFGSRDLELATQILNEEQIDEIVKKYDIGKKGK